MADYGIVFDIDGVLLRGKEVIPGAVEAVQKVQAAGVPFCFVTNNGMESEAQRAARLSASLGLPVPAANMVLNHSGLQEEVAELGDQLVLVTGYSHSDAAGILRGYGFRKVRSLAEFAAAHPQLVPGPHERYPPGAPGGPPAWARERVAAVMVIETPVDWHQDLQLIVDLVRTGGDVLGGREAVAAADEAPQAVRLYHCNFDFYYMDAYSLPRFGPGAFLLLLQTLFARATGGRELQVLRHGKPNPPAYVCAAHKLQRQLGRPGAALRHIYAVGDNPASDVRGANAAGGPWRSVLVRTGVFHGAGNDAGDPAHYVADDVRQAVGVIMAAEAERALQAPQGASHACVTSAGH